MCGCHYGMFTVGNIFERSLRRGSCYINRKKLVVITTGKQILTPSNENADEALFPVKIDVNS